MSPEDRELLRAALEARKRKVSGGRRPPRPREPRSAQSRYVADVRRVSRRVSKLIAATVAPHVRRAERAERRDAVIDLADIGVDFGLLEVRIARLVREMDLSDLVDKNGRRIAKANAKDLERVLGISLTAEPAEIQIALREWRASNVALIKTIPERAHADVRRLVGEAATSGMRVETLKKRLRERFAVSDSRAELIARDQTLKANSQFTQIRHREVGIRRYVWDTSSDERVREMHRELDGRTFSWDDPPVTNPAGDRNHPGEDYQCRCVAIPVLPGT